MKHNGKLNKGFTEKIIKKKRNTDSAFFKKGTKAEKQRSSCEHQWIRETKIVFRLKQSVKYSWWPKRNRYIY